MMTWIRMLVAVSLLVALGAGCIPVYRTGGHSHHGYAGRPVHQDDRDEDGDRGRHLGHDKRRGNSGK